MTETATPDDVAAWMMAELGRQDELYQIDAVSEIERRFGRSFVRDNELGNTAIAKNVLTAFRKLSGDSVVWSASERYWRPRHRGDDPGRRQAE